MTLIENAIPKGALPALVLVLLYSFLCLAAGILLTFMLFTSRERFSCIIISVTTCKEPY